MKPTRSCTGTWAARSPTKTMDRMPTCTRLRSECCVYTRDDDRHIASSSTLPMSVGFVAWHFTVNKLCARPPQYAPAPCKLTLKAVSESGVTWATSVPILIFLGLSVLDVGPMYATERQTDVRRASSLNASAMGAGYNNNTSGQ